MTDKIPKVLVVDDEEELAEFLAKSIARKNILTKICYNGLEAVEFLRNERVDAVLTDMRMPQMGGHELVAWMKKNLDPVPATYVLTGYADENKEALRDLQPNGVFQKPADIKDCVAAVVAAAQKKLSPA